MNKLTDLEVAIKLEEIEKEQETLEESSENYAEQYKYIGGKISFKRGAKWQQERMYSEEEVLDIIKSRENYLDNTPKKSLYINVKEWFEQYKKK